MNLVQRWRVTEVPGPSNASFILPFIALFAMFTTAVWVYRDATAQSERGTSIFFHVGTFNVDTPIAWFVACIFLWIVFFPLYLAARSR